MTLQCSFSELSVLPFLYNQVEPSSMSGLLMNPLTWVGFRPLIQKVRLSMYSLTFSISVVADAVPVV